jgi:hypothetical protein
VNPSCVWDGTGAFEQEGIREGINRKVRCVIW